MIEILSNMTFGKYVLLHMLIVNCGICFYKFFDSISNLIFDFIDFIIKKIIQKCRIKKKV